MLWFLSSTQGAGAPLPIDHIDKLAHVVYFAAGGFLLSGWLYFRKPGNPSWKRILTLAIVTIALIGVLDEYHQSFTPNRSGNDPGDMLADLLGAIAGAFLFKTLHRWFRWDS
jgi:VanZ family protein